MLELIYPGSLYCICCGKIIDASRPYRLCNECMAGMKWATGRLCAKCGKPLSASDPGDICYSCREHHHSFDKGFACAEYGMHERAVIFSLKYNGRTHIAHTVAEMMSDRLRGEAVYDDIDMVVPVPMFRQKKLKRGFDQSELIARELAGRMGTEFRGDIVLRRKDTRAMRGLSPAERRDNLRGVFAAGEGCGSRELSGKRVLIVDDIYTTGATADAVTDILKAAGAEYVYFIAFAAGADVVKSI